MSAFLSFTQTFHPLCYTQNIDIRAKMQFRVFYEPMPCLQKTNIYYQKPLVQYSPLRRLRDKETIPLSITNRERYLPKYAYISNYTSTFLIKYLLEFLFKNPSTVLSSIYNSDFHSFPQVYISFFFCMHYL